MKRIAIPRVLAVVSCLVLVAILGMPLLQVAPASAAAAAPKVTVYLKNFHEEYNLATSEFLAAQFDDLDSRAYGLVSYTVVTTLTQAALTGSVALVIDDSADMSLTEADAALIRNFVNLGGRVGIFTFPRFYWDHEGPNPAAIQVVADLFGNATIGQPSATELASGQSSAEVEAEGCSQAICFTQPYNMIGATVTNYDHAPFTPITSTGTSPILISAALNGAAVAVANSHGMLVTNPIGDMVQGGDSNLAYRQFVADAIVWLANPLGLAPNRVFMPIVQRH